MSPAGRLVGGYGYVTKGDQPVLSTSLVKVGDTIGIRLSDGNILARAEEIREEDHGKEQISD